MVVTDDITEILEVYQDRYDETLIDVLKRLLQPGARGSGSIMPFDQPDKEIEMKITAYCNDFSFSWSEHSGSPGHTTPWEHWILYQEEGRSYPYYISNTALYSLWGLWLCVLEDGLYIDEYAIVAFDDILFDATCPMQSLHPEYQVMFRLVSLLVNNYCWNGAHEWGIDLHDTIEEQVWISKHATITHSSEWDTLPATLEYLSDHNIDITDYCSVDVCYYPGDWIDDVDSNAVVYVQESGLITRVFPMLQGVSYDERIDAGLVIALEGLLSERPEHWHTLLWLNDVNQHDATFLDRIRQETPALSRHADAIEAAYRARDHEVFSKSLQVFYSEAKEAGVWVVV